MSGEARTQGCHPAKFQIRAISFCSYTSRPYYANERTGHALDTISLSKQDPTGPILYSSRAIWMFYISFHSHSVPTCPYAGILNRRHPISRYVKRHVINSHKRLVSENSPLIIISTAKCGMDPSNRGNMVIEWSFQYIPKRLQRRK